MLQPEDENPAVLKQKIKDVLLGLLIAAVMMVLAGEALIRLFGHELVYEQDDLLGWRPRAGFTAHYERRDPSGASYAVDYSTDARGFRMFGQTQGPRPRVLFLGDSFTGDPNTSNADAYFAVVGQKLPVEVFAVGAGGYGTLQQALLIQPWVDVIKPDVLVLQYCTNDLSDNSFELEAHTSHVRNQKNLRPYWVNGAVVHRLPRYHPYVLLHRYSRLFRKIDIEVMMLQYRFDDPARRAQTPAQLQARADALVLTGQLMARIAASMPAGTRKLSISCDTSDAQEAANWQALARTAGFEPLPSVSGRVEQAGQRGEAVRTLDRTHWNRLGNRLAGEELARLLAERQVGTAQARP